MDSSLSQYKELFINESNEIIANLNQALLNLEKNPSNADLINDTFRYLHNIKGMAATMGYEKITKISHELETVMDTVRKGQKHLTAEMINVVFKGIDWLETLINGLGKRSDGEYNLSPLFEEIKTVLLEPDKIPEKKEAAQKSPIEGFNAPATLRIDIKILDDLINQIGELVISKNRLHDITHGIDDSELSNALYNTNKIISSLENTILKTRIVPADYIFSRFPRMVRDLTREQKKEINFVIEGKDIGLDRGVLDELYEPLIHILRNCVYHGIELPEARKKSDKNPTGKIVLSAKKLENDVIIEIEDDGGGINIEKVREVALKKGLIKPDETGRMSEKEYFNLLTLPGFTTVTSADKTSGRGVGLDVVKTKIESLNGAFRIESKPKKGSKFIIKVPLTLAIIQALIVDVYGETYALPFSIVKEVFSVKDTNDGKVDYKGKLIPLIKLKEVLQITEDKNFSAKEILITEYRNKEIGIEITKIRSQHEIVVKPLNKFLKPSHIFSGATILSTGEVVLILDINTIINEGEK